MQSAQESEMGEDHTPPQDKIKLLFPVITTIDLLNYDMVHIRKVIYVCLVTRPLTTVTLFQICDCIRQQSQLIAQKPKLANGHLSEFLSFHMNLFELDPKTEESSPSPSSQPSPVALSPRRVVYSRMVPVAAKVSLKRKCLALLHELVGVIKPISKLWSCWHAFLPR